MRALFINNSGADINTRIGRIPITIKVDDIVPDKSHLAQGMTASSFMHLCSDGFLSKYAGPDPDYVPPTDLNALTPEEQAMIQRKRTYDNKVAASRTRPYVQPDQPPAMPLSAAAEEVSNSMNVRSRGVTPANTQPQGSSLPPATAQPPVQAPIAAQVPVAPPVQAPVVEQQPPVQIQVPAPVAPPVPQVQVPVPQPVPTQVQAPVAPPVAQHPMAPAAPVAPPVVPPVAPPVQEVQTTPPLVGQPIPQAQPQAEVPPPAQVQQSVQNSATGQRAGDILTEDETP